MLSYAHPLHLILWMVHICQDYVTSSNPPSNNTKAWGLHLFSHFARPEYFTASEMGYQRTGSAHAVNQEHPGCRHLYLNLFMSWQPSTNLPVSANNPITITAARKQYVESGDYQYAPECAMLMMTMMIMPITTNTTCRQFPVVVVAANHAASTLLFLPICSAVE